MWRRVELPRSRRAARARAPRCTLGWDGRVGRRGCLDSLNGTAPPPRGAGRRTSSCGGRRRARGARARRPLPHRRRPPLPDAQGRAARAPPRSTARRAPRRARAPMPSARRPVGPRAAGWLARGCCRAGTRARSRCAYPGGRARERQPASRPVRVSAAICGRAAAARRRCARCSARHGRPRRRAACHRGKRGGYIRARRTSCRPTTRRRGPRWCSRGARRARTYARHVTCAGQLSS